MENIKLTIQSVEPTKRKDGSKVEGISRKGVKWQLFKINGKYVYFQYRDGVPDFEIGKTYSFQLEETEKDGYINYQLTYNPPKEGVEVQRESTQNEWVKAIPTTQDDLTALWDEIKIIQGRLDALEGGIPVVDD